MNLKTLNNDTLVSHLQRLVTQERRLTAEILESIKEVDTRRLYIQLGYPSLFAYLTEGLGYSAGAAQRRIDSARLMREVPAISEQIKEGLLNLMQVAMVAQSCRQKAKEDPKAEIKSRQKQDLLETIKGHDVATTQKLIATALDLKVQDREIKRVQQDESLRIDVTLPKELRSDLQRIKELISHAHPNPGLVDIITLLAAEFLKRKDPLRKPIASKVETRGAESSSSDCPRNLAAKLNKPQNSQLRRRHIPNSVRRAVVQRDRVCQWRDPVTGTAPVKPRDTCQFAARECRFAAID